MRFCQLAEPKFNVYLENITLANLVFVIHIVMMISLSSNVFKRSIFFGHQTFNFRAALNGFKHRKYSSLEDINCCLSISYLQSSFVNERCRL